MGGVCAAQDEEDEVIFTPRKQPQEKGRIITVDTKDVPSKMGAQREEEEEEEREEDQERDLRVAVPKAAKKQPPPGYKFQDEKNHRRMPSELSERQNSGPYSRKPSRGESRRSSRRETSRSQPRGSIRGRGRGSYRPSRDTVRSSASNITNADETRMKIATYLEKKGEDAPARPSLLYKNKKRKSEYDNNTSSFMPTEYRRSFLMERQQRGFSMLDTRKQRPGFQNVQRTQSLRRLSKTPSRRSKSQLLQRQIHRRPSSQRLSRRSKSENAKNFQFNSEPRGRRVSKNDAFRNSYTTRKDPLAKQQIMRRTNSQRHRNSRQPTRSSSKSAFSDSDSGHQTVSPSYSDNYKRMKTRPVQKSGPNYRHHSDRSLSPQRTPKHEARSVKRQMYPGYEDERYEPLYE